MDTNNICSICLDVINKTSNITITECGHYYHSKCLMINNDVNGHCCPICRFQMVENSELVSNVSDETFDTIDTFSYFDDYDIYNDNINHFPNENQVENMLTTFRLFHMHIDPNNIEQEQTEDFNMVEQEHNKEIENIAQEFKKRKITYNELVNVYLYTQFFNTNDYYKKIKHNISINKEKKIKGIMNSMQLYQNYDIDFYTNEHFNF